jgi:hypothetical protein
MRAKSTNYSCFKLRVTEVYLSHISLIATIARYNFNGVHASGQ